MNEDIGGSGRENTGMAEVKSMELCHGEVSLAALW